jgi:hypothetical protein
MGRQISARVGRMYALFNLAMDSKMPLAAEYVGAGYEVKAPPESGLFHMAAGPAISSCTS